MVGAALLLSAILALVAGQTTNVDQCVSHDGDRPININIQGCVNQPCALPQLQDAIIDIVFKAPYTMRSMRTLATAYMAIGPVVLPIPYDLGAQAETCNFLTNSYCPVLKDEVLQYTLRMYIEAFFPVGTSVTIEFRVVDESSIPVLCVRVGVRIDPPTGTRGLDASNGTLVVEAL